MSAAAPRLGPRPGPRRRGAGLTPMIDVVFLLLVFFMLAARFGAERALDLSLGGAGGAWQGPPRLVEVGPAGLRLNGVPVAEGGLAAALAPLMPAPDAPVVLRPGPGAVTADVARALAALRAAGAAQVALVPPAGG